MKKYKRNNSYKKFIYLIMACVVFAISGCESFVETDIPSSQISGEMVFNDIKTAESALADVYSQIRDNSLFAGNTSGISILLGLYSDELVNYNTWNSGLEAFYTNNLQASSSSNEILWNRSFNLIFATNAVIEGIENSGELAAEESELLLGQAYFIRAFIHFYLVNMYGDIPYIRTTDYTINQDVSRLSKMIVFEEITTDLHYAAELLPENYISDLRVKPNKFAAHALLARVNLYKDDWENSIKQASMVIEETTMYQLNEDLNQVFKNNSNSTIWQLHPGNATSNTLQGQTFIFNSGPPPITALTDSLLVSFEENDLRAVHWVQSVGDSINNWQHPYKYKINSNTGSEEFSIVLRLAEMYLIRAEANFNLGNRDESIQDLNIVRERAGLSPLTGIAIEDLRELILRERFHEFFTEFGHRFFDLKRNQLLDEVLNYKEGWEGHNELLPLPESELLLNSNLLPQNPNY
ncbi:MAG: RagB/SusD family nutrient uptake outer membrane protein [Bacteroidota bacterium]